MGDNPGKNAEYRRRTVQVNGREYGRNWELKKKYGITLLVWRKMLDGVGNACEICLHPDPRNEPEGHRGRGRMAVDHNHVTSEIRGVLCYTCNRAIGQLGVDDPKRVDALIRYLTKGKTI